MSEGEDSRPDKPTFTRLDKALKDREVARFGDESLVEYSAIETVHKDKSAYMIALLFILVVAGLIVLFVGVGIWALLGFPGLG